MVRSKISLFVSFLALLFHNNAQANIGIFGGSGSRLRKETTTFSLVSNPFDRSDDIKTLDELILPLLGSAITTTYGISLILNTKQCEGQLRCMTMFRATGHSRLQTAMEEFRKNLRDACLSVAIRSPSFYLAQRSIKKLDDRVVDAYKLLKDTQKAKSDGIVTRHEAKQLRKQRIKEIRNIKRDMRRLVKAGSHIQHVIQSLDIDEISDLMRSFAFQLLAVLSVGEHYDGDNNNATTAATSTSTRRGSFLANLCLLKNLGSLALDVNTKLQFPISTIILNTLSSTSSSSDDHRNKLISQDKLENSGKFVTYGTSTYLVVRKNSFARKLNNSLLSASVVIRGIKNFVQTMLLEHDDDDDNGNNSIWFAISKFLNGRTGGMLMITLATVSFYICDRQEEEENAVKDLTTNNEEGDEEEDDGVTTATATTTTTHSVTGDNTNQQQAPPRMKIFVPQWIQYVHSRIENGIRKLTVFLEEAL